MTTEQGERGDWRKCIASTKEGHVFKKPAPDKLSAAAEKQNHRRRQLSLQPFRRLQRELSPCRESGVGVRDFFYWNPSTDTMIPGNKACMTEGKFETITAEVRNQLLAIHRRQSMEYSGVLMRFITAEIEKRVRLHDSLKICEQNLQAEKEKRANLEVDFEFFKQGFEQEKEKHICQICMENVRNAVILPCLHFLFFSGSLNYHQKTSSACPTCRGAIGAVINCKFNVE